MKIAYEGTSFSGWQIQPDSDSIQQRIEDALEIILKERVRIIGSGRTDAGVHALGQVAHFKYPSSIDTKRTLFSLNGILPKSIRILSLENAPADFHAQYSAISKTYHYRLCLSPVENPLQRNYRVHEPRKIDLDLLHQGIQPLLGSHDFSAFANKQTVGSAGKDPVRNLKRIDIIEEEGGIRLEFESNGFLYKMVRNIVGTLLEVGLSKRPPDDVVRILNSKDRRQASMAAPPKGLVLFHVDYFNE